jgi:DNA repair exonuclease SbcCD ATPase subunit/DNA repair exonuclease SbcCD nuclease subunit
MKYKYIVHLADIHIRTGTETYSRYYEYLAVFENLKLSLISNNINQNNSIILVAGDIFHNKNKVENFGLHLFKTFINILTNIATTIIIPGNHDFLQQYPDDPTLLDSILLTNIFNLHYLNTTTTLSLKNIGISTISVKDTLIPGEGSGIIKNLPSFPTNFSNNISTKVALFHGSFCKTYFNHNQEVDQNNSYPLEMLNNFDIACLGDIHLYQSNIYKNCSYAYSGSLIQQNFGEDILDHGYLIWNIKTKKSTHIPIYNPYGFVIFKYINDIWNIKYNNNFIPTNNIINNSHFPKNISIRIDGTYNNIDLLHNTLKSYNITIIDIKNIIIPNKITKQHSTQNFTDTNYFKLYFNNPIISNYIDNPNDLLIPFDYLPIINKRNEKITQAITYYQNATELDNQNKTLHKTFNILTLEFDNCLCYGNKNKINFELFNNKSVIINAPNGFGKSALYEIICYAIYGEPMPSRQTKRFSASFINSKYNKANTTIYLNINTNTYIIKRTFKKTDNTLKITECSLSSESIKTITGTKLIQKWLENNLGTIEEFLKTSMITQDFDFSFLNLDPKNIKKYIDNNINLNTIIKFKDLIKESFNSYKDILQHIDTALLQLNYNVIEIDFNEQTIIDHINQLNLSKELLYNKLEHIDYNKFTINELENPPINNINTSNLKNYYSVVNTKSIKINCDIIEITPYLNTNFTELEQELTHLLSNEPNKPTNTIIPHNLSILISTQFNNIQTIFNIINQYNNTSINTSSTCKIDLDNLNNLNHLQEQYKTINNNINNNNIEIQKLQKNINDLNHSLHSLKNINKPTITLKDANEAINYFNVLNTKYTKKYNIFTKYNTELKKLEKEYCKPSISLDLCYQYINEFNTLHNLKDTYDIQIEIEETTKQLKQYKSIEYNPKCNICMKQPWIVKKLELENKIITLNNNINYCILNPKKYFNRYIYLKNNLEHYNNNIHLHNIENNINTIKSKNIFDWIQEYDYLKDNLQNYYNTIEQHKLYENYQNDLNSINNKIKINLQQLNIIQSNNDSHNNNKNNIDQELNNIYFTINQAYKLYKPYQLEIWNQWNDKIQNIKHILTFKIHVENYQQLQDYKDLQLWNQYFHYEEIIKYSKIHFKRKELLNKIKIIENDINLLIIYKTNMISQFDIYNKNKIQYNKLYNLQNNINKSIHTFKIILDNYDHFQKWIYDTHILPNIISNVNSIIKQSTINHFIINAFVDNDGIQFSINNTAITKASGFQKFIINIALRISFLELYNNKSFCSQLFIDEGWTSADSNNRNLIPKVLNYLLTKFDSVILVSHIDEIKDITDLSIKINKNKDSSHIYI